MSQRLVFGHTLQVCLVLHCLDSVYSVYDILLIIHQFLNYVMNFGLDDFSNAGKATPQLSNKNQVAKLLSRTLVL